MKIPTFTEPYESKLKELKIKTKFVDMLRANLLEGETIEQAIEYLNHQPSWTMFIFGASDFTKASKEEMEFWTKIAKS